MIEFGHATHVGLRREHNEDTYFADGTLGLWLVADGMGGHAHGEVASAIARETVAREVADGATLEAAIREADAGILRQSTRSPEALPMGTTVAALQLRDQVANIAWVGDSRIYIFENKNLKQISQDHSYVQELVSKGAISPDEARKHPQRNVVTQALGITAPSELHVATVSQSATVGTQFLLCTDGLTEEVDDARISNILARTELATQESVDQLVLAALENGGNDNITVILVRLR